MAGLEEHLHAWLAADAAVAAIVAARIHPVAAPQDVARPFIVYRLVSRVPFAALTGPSEQARSRVTITAWAETWVASRDLAAAVANALDGIPPPLAGVIHAARVVATVEGFDSAAELFGRSLDVSIIHAE